MPFSVGPIFALFVLDANAGFGSICVCPGRLTGEASQQMSMAEIRCTYVANRLDSGPDQILERGWDGTFTVFPARGEIEADIASIADEGGEDVQNV